MWKSSSVLILFTLVFGGCSQPKGTVFEDNRLAQEEMVKFCFLGDLGIGTEHQEVIAKALKKENCHRIIFLGDLVYDKGINSPDDPELEEKFLRYYDPLFEDNPNLIILLLLGNHDYQGSTNAWIKYAKQDERYFFPYYYYFVDYGGLCLVALDTNLFFDIEKSISASEQTLWLTGLQSRLKDCDAKIAVSHHPFKGGGYSGSKDWEGAKGSLKIFLDSYVIGRFDLHIAGHVHLLEDDGKDEGTRMLLSGTGGENRGDGKSGYVVINWNPSNPKRLGYHLKSIDTQLNVFSEDLMQEQVEHEDYSASPGLLSKIKSWFKNLFQD